MPIHQFFKGLVQRPQLVLVVSLFLLAFGLTMDGTIFRLWDLYRENKRMSRQVQITEAQIREIQAKIAMASDPGIIEREAKDRLDMVQDHDLIFLFPDAPSQSR